MNLWHLTFSTRGRQVIFTSEAGVLEGVRALARAAGERVVLFSIVDDHVHTVVRSNEPGSLTPGLLRALRAVAEAELDPAHRRAVTNRRHLEWLASHYIMEQPGKHGLPTHPALWTGSCFLDLLGARRIEGLALQLPRVLPRFRLRQAFQAVGLEARPLVPMAVDELRAVGAHRVVRAAAAAVGMPEARSRGRLARTARLAAATLCREAGVASVELAAVLGYRTSSVCKLMRQPSDPAIVRATLLRLALEERIGHAAPNHDHADA